jgi:nitrite reductase/ring-hydroxylating ferredoxin subunit
MSLPDPNWIPVALSRDLEASSSMGTLIGDQEVVVWRDSAGAAHAWEDRCPHRGMRLSFGFVRGNHIACLYHGWEFGTDGQCRRIPAHPELEVPKAIKTVRYFCREAAGLVWVCMGSPDEPPLPDGLPDGEIVAVRSLYCEVPVETLAHVLLSDARLPQGIATSGAPERAGTLVTVPLGEGRIFAGLQPLSRERSALHLALSGCGVETAKQMAPMLLDWTERLRRRLAIVPMRSELQLEGAAR